MALKEELKKLSHHAYVIVGGLGVGGGQNTHDVLLEVLNKVHKIPIRANADLFDRSYENFTIDNAREIKAVHEMRPVKEGAKQIFILTMNGITVEAQNALLKLLEEPAEYAHFFIIIPSAGLLLPTVKSRVCIVSDIVSDGPVSSGAVGGGLVSGTHTKSAQNLGRFGKDVKNNVADTKLSSTKPATSFQTSFKTDNLALDFLESKPAKRLELIKKLLDDISKEKKTNQDAINFVDELEATIRNSARTNAHTNARAQTRGSTSAESLKNVRPQLEAIQTARNYMNDRAPSLKMLLEYLALNI